MNVLFEITESGYKLQDKFASHFKQLSNDKFVVSSITKDLRCLDYLEKQKTFNKIFTHRYFDFSKDLKDYKINYDLLELFEERLDNTSVWNIISSDRTLGRIYLHDFIGYDYNSPTGTYDELLKFFSFKLEELTKIFDDFRPNIFVPAFCISNMDSLIIYNLCKSRNIIYANYTSLRIQNYFTFSNDLMKSTPVIEKSFKEKIINYKDGLFKEGEKLYDELMEEIKAPKYFDRHSLRVQKHDFSSFKKNFIYTINLLKLIFVGKNRTFSSVKNKILNFRFIYLTLREFFLHILQKIKMTKNKFYAVNKNENYVYYTLHSAPEYSVNMQGNFWSNQIYNLEIISKSLPASWKLYTKEHPATLSDRTRPLNFFSRIKKIPNVKVLNTYEDMHEIISNAKAVIVVVGTAGIEAILRGKPSIAFTDNTWDMLELSKIVQKAENLPSLIKTTVKENQNITDKYRKKRLVCYFQSLIKDAFWLSHPGAATWLEETNSETENTCGSELAKGLINYLNSLENYENKKY